MCSTRSFTCITRISALHVSAQSEHDAARSILPDTFILKRLSPD